MTTARDDIEALDSKIDTAVDTLTVEMDRQFKEVRTDIAALRTDMDQQFKEVHGKMDAMEARLLEAIRSNGSKP